MSIDNGKTGISIAADFRLITIDRNFLYRIDDFFSILEFIQIGKAAHPAALFIEHQCLISLLAICQQNYSNIVGANTVPVIIILPDLQNINGNAAEVINK